MATEIWKKGDDELQQLPAALESAPVAAGTNNGDDEAAGAPLSAKDEKLLAAILHAAKQEITDTPGWEAGAGDDIPPLFSLEEGRLGRLGVEAKAPAAPVLGPGRLDLAPATGGNVSLLHPQLPRRLPL